MKIAIIGAGSTYTPELMEGIIASSINGLLPINEVCLMDIDADRLGIVGAFCSRMISHSGARVALSSTVSLEVAISKSQFVITQVRVGGSLTRHQDIVMGKRHGLIGQETVGVGGFAKALRTAPVIAEICRTIRTHAPNAWLINFTNPASIISQIMIDYFSDIRWVGLCNYPTNMKMSICKWLKIDDDTRLTVDYVANHLSWITAVYLDFMDVTHQVLERYNAEFSLSNIARDGFNPSLLRNLNILLNPYLKYYYQPRHVIEMQQTEAKSRAEEVMEIDKQLLTMYSDQTLVTKPAELMKRGGAYYSTAAVRLMQSLHNNTRDTQIVNTRNNHCIDDLPAHASIECNCTIGSDRATPQHYGAIPHSIKPLISSVKAYEFYTSKAAMEGDTSAAYMALLSNPLVGDADIAEAVLDYILHTYKHFLPQFGK